MSISLSPPYAPRRASVRPAPMPSYQEDVLALDYLTQAVGPVLYTGTAAKQWFEAQGEPPLPGEETQGIFQAHCLLHCLHQRGETPSAILCDAVLPDGTAIGWREWLDRDEALRQIPFLVVGNPLTWPDTEVARQVGVDDCLDPDWPLSRLTHRLRFLCRYKSRLLPVQGREPKHIRVNLPLWKRILDILLSSMLLLFLAPVWIYMVARWIGKRKGPLIERIPRIGIGYELIHCLAFTAEESTATNWWVHVPRLWNVLRGDMSLVGNRALPLTEASALTTDQWAGRFLAPVGLTGPWRVQRQHGVYLSPTEQRTLEIAYANNIGLRQDIYWLWRTMQGLFYAV